MTLYSLQDHQGEVISTHEDYDEAWTAAQEWAGAHGIVGHDGDLEEGGDRTLVWADEEDSRVDDGARAIGSIRKSDVDFVPASVEEDEEGNLWAKHQYWRERLER